MRLSSVLCLGLLAACAPKSEAPPAAAAAPLSTGELDVVKAVDAAFATAMNAKDTTAVFALYTADARLMPPNSPILQGAAIHALVVNFLAGGGGDFVLTPSTVYGVGDLAYVVGTATYKMGGASETVKYAEVLRKGADGKWQFAVDMFSEVAPPPAATAAKKN